MGVGLAAPALGLKINLVRMLCFLEEKGFSSVISSMGFILWLKIHRPDADNPVPTADR
jgi:hypothetical protein